MRKSMIALGFKNKTSHNLGAVVFLIIISFTAQASLKEYCIKLLNSVFSEYFFLNPKKQQVVTSYDFDNIDHENLANVPPGDLTPFTLNWADSAWRQAVGYYTGSGYWHFNNNADPALIKMFILRWNQEAKDPRKIYTVNKISPDIEPFSFATLRRIGHLNYFLASSGQVPRKIRRTYSGGKFNPVDLEKLKKLSGQTNAYFSFNSFLSTSSKASVAAGYADRRSNGSAVQQPVIMFVTGYSSKDVMPLSSVPREHEFLYPSRALFVIESFEELSYSEIVERGKHPDSELHEIAKYLNSKHAGTYTIIKLKEFGMDALVATSRNHPTEMLLDKSLPFQGAIEQTKIKNYIDTIFPIPPPGGGMGSSNNQRNSELNFRFLEYKKQKSIESVINHHLVLPAYRAGQILANEIANKLLYSLINNKLGSFPLLQSLKNLHSKISQGDLFEGYYARRVLRETSVDKICQLISSYASEIDDAPGLSQTLSIEASKVWLKKIESLLRSSNPKYFKPILIELYGNPPRGKFRKDSLDEFSMQGLIRVESSSDIDQWYFTAEDFISVAQNPFFYLDYKQPLLSYGDGDLLRANVYFTRVNAIEANLVNILNKILPSIQTNYTNQNWVNYIMDVTVLRQASMNIHPFVDGNGRTIQTFIDIFFAVAHLPIPNYHIEGDFSLTPIELFYETIKGMRGSPLKPI